MAATVWAAQESLDIRAFGVPYSDVALLARPVGGNRLAGLAIHISNGAIFGSVFAALAPRLPGPAVAKGAAAGMAEHLATWPLTRFLPGVDLWGNRRAFWQAVWRHLLFGLLLGLLADRFGQSQGYAHRAPA